MSKTQEYSKLSHEEHVLKLPDTYIGDIDINTLESWYFCNDKNKMVQGELNYIPGEYKLFDELIVNSFDQYIRLIETDEKDIFPVKNIKVTCNKETGEISVYNDGEGIKIEMHETEKMYIPQLIFGELLTSSNYKEDELKHVGGKNGYGAKLVNIFSKEFTIETIDSNNKLKFTMTYYDNKSRHTKPKITKYSSKPYTKITYTPDYTRFKSDGLSDDMMKIMLKRCYDLAACTDNSINIYFNNEKLDCKNFEKYINLYIGTKDEKFRVYENVNTRWEIGACLSESSNFEQISFVNGINTIKGGKHVDYISNQITKKMSEWISKKKKVTIKPNYIKENLMIFIRCTIDNPSFSSQTKETLTTNKDKFGRPCDISNKFIEQLSKSGIVERALELSSVKDFKSLKKNDGKKQNRLKGIPKLEDANWAGTKNSNSCTLIITEGDSAKSTAMAGLEIIGRDKYGIFPLKGKLLNVRDIKNIKKIMENNEINNIKKIIGLQTNVVYENTNNLRYGKIMILTDQDEDGSHIKGLLFNLFDTLWPSLFKFNGFLTSMLTPIVKVKINKNKFIEFFSLKDFKKWEEENNDGNWSAKYYKGLGTSTPKEAKEYFKIPKMVEYTAEESNDLDMMRMAFSKNDNSANNRKEWLKSYNKENTLDYKNSIVSISNFVQKDLKHFSNSDNIRSIPSCIDGLKPSQRKVLYGSIKRNLYKTEIKVAQLAGYISENAAYHHGEASLQGTIVNMAQNYVGSNNIELLDPVGQFGTRILGGKDSAQPRYIYTKLSSITALIFNKKDDPLYKNQYDEGMQIEPINYVPVIPMVLVNGCQGIGTGWSTDIPNFNPLDIINNIYNYINDIDFKEMKPYYRGFEGSIIKDIESSNYISKGIFEIKSNKLIIKELPIGVWTDKYKEFLESICVDNKTKSKKQIIRYYNSYCTDTKINFELFMDKDYLSGLSKEQIEKTFKLTSTINITNMVLYNADSTINKYSSVLDILKDFCIVRLELYNKRKEHLIGELEKTIDLLEIKIRFINDFINENIKIIKVKKIEIIKQMETKNYPKIDDSYDYLLKMPIYNLTLEKIEEFEEKLNNLNTELELIKSKTSKDLWSEDLVDIKKELVDKYNYKFIVKKLKIKK